MLFLTQFKLAGIDKKITRLLRESNFYIGNKDNDKYKMSLNDIDRDEPWVKEVEKFIDLVWSENIYRKLFEPHKLTRQDLVDFFILMTIASMPNPLFKSGSARMTHTLVGSAMYQEINKQLITCLQSLGYFDNKEEQKQFGHRYASDVMSFASGLKFAHDRKYGPITLEEAL